MLRRIATNLVGDALEDKNIGRFASAARQLDIELSDLVKESSGIDSLITLTPPTPGENLELFQNLPENVGMQLLDAIDSERRGILKNARVRQYLRALPLGITQQSYWLHENGRILREVSFGAMDISILPPDLPYIVHCVGKVVGVGFEPGRPEVRVKTETATVTLSATSQQVDRALDLRYSSVTAVTVVQGTAHRLLILQASHLPIYRSTRDAAVFDRWRGVLQRLAQ